MKPFRTLLTLAALAITLAARAADAPATNPPPLAPKLTPEAEAAARAALNKASAETNPASPAPTRAAPTRVTNAPATPAATVTATPAATVKATPGNLTAAATTPAAAPAPAQPQQPAATLPQFPAPGAARALTNRVATASAQTNRPPTTTTTATPIIPGAAQPPAAGQRNVAGTPQPGGANTATAPGIAAPGANAQPNRNEDILPPGLIKFQDADIGQVLEIYQELTGLTVLKPSSLPATKVSIRTQTELTRIEAVQALDSILSMNGITMTPQGTKFVKAVAEAQAGNAASPFNDLPAELLPESGTYVTHVIQLTNASPNDVLPVLTPFAKAPNSILTIPSTGMLVLRDYAENVKRMLEMIAKVDVVPVQEFESVVIPIKYALAGDIAQVLGGLTAGGGGVTTVGGQRSSTGLSGGGGGFGGAGGLGGAGGQFGQPGYNPNGQNQRGGLGGAGGLGGLGGAGGQRGSFQNRLQQIVNRAGPGGGGGASGDIFVLGSTKIIADERINALLIFASKTDLLTISNIIDKLDVVLAQVLIEAIIMEVSLGNQLDYGFSYLQTKPATAGDFLLGGVGAINNIKFQKLNDFTDFGVGGSSTPGGTNGGGPIPSGFSYAARFMGFDAVAKAFAGDSRVKILQRPRIQTSHAVEANLFVGQTRPYPTGTSYGGFGGGGYSSIQQLQIGVTLTVLPLINAEGLVVMDIRQKIQDVGEEVTIANVGSVPSTIDREANCKVAVRDGETVMVGGMIAASKNNTKSGVPILKDIPILGALFRSTSSSDTRRELVILIRPTVLPTPESAATYVKDQRPNNPATSQAADDFEESERKLVEEEKKRLEKKNQKLYKKEGFSK